MIAGPDVPGCRRRCRRRRWLGDGRRGLRSGRLPGSHTIDAFAVGLLGRQRQAELLAHNTGKEAAHRVLLPTGRLHDGGDRRTCRPSKQGEDGFLLGRAAGRTCGPVPRLFCAALGAHKLGVVGGFAMRHVRIPFSCDGTKRRHHRSPAAATKPAGRNPRKANGLHRCRNSDALFVPKCQSFLDNVMAVFRFSRSWNDPAGCRSRSANLAMASLLV